MDASSTADDTRTILLANDDDERASQTHEIVLAIDEMMPMATETLKAQFSKVDPRIHRLPRGLRGIGGDNRYIVPRIVAIGPYHHGSPHLQKMEEVKLAAAYFLCKHSGRSTSSMEVYEKILSIVGDARGCYDADDPSVLGLSDADFAAMMFLDGCFLLQYMVGAGGRGEPVLRNQLTLSTRHDIQRDIFLLENQIPWLVLQVLSEFMPVNVLSFVAGMQEKLQPGKGEEEVPWWRRCGSTLMPDRNRRGPGRRNDIGSGADDDYTPPHLLGLLWYVQVGSMPAAVKNKNYMDFESSSLKSSSATDLAEIGVKLTPNTTVPWFGDMSFRYRRCLFGELSLSPVFLNDITACWLVNIAALEASTSGVSDADGYTVSSYLSVLAMLMDRVEDVRKLRSNCILDSTFSSTQALDFFKGFAQDLRFGDRYFATLEAIYSYSRHSSVRIFTYRLIYKHYRAIAAAMSVAGVLFSILSQLYSLKKPCKT